MVLLKQQQHNCWHHLSFSLVFVARETAVTWIPQMPASGILPGATLAFQQQLWAGEDEGALRELCPLTGDNLGAVSPHR